MHRYPRKPIVLVLRGTDDPGRGCFDAQCNVVNEEPGLQPLPANIGNARSLYTDLVATLCPGATADCDGADPSTAGSVQLLAGP